MTELDFAEVVIIGSGFGGLAAAKQLGKSGIDHTLISATPEHLFQPLLYQVATGVMDPDEIAPPIANVLRANKGSTVVQGDVVDVDPDACIVTYETADGIRRLRYGSLIAATGATQSYFGNDHFKDFTFALKTIDDATLLRDQIRTCFERAAETTDDAERRRLLNFVIVGAGATGVEVAGQIQELSQRYFHADASVYLVEGAPMVLPPYKGGKLSRYAEKSLTDSGVEVLLDAMVTAIDGDGVTISINKGAATRRITADTVVWSAGVQASGFAAVLAERTGCDTDRAGRLLINSDLTTGGYANIYAIGDMTSLKGYPGQSPVAMQQGRHAADIIRRKKLPGTEFVYWDKGSMATINRFSAVAQINERIQFRGFIAWLMWLAVHLFYLIGFRNRFVAVLQWGVAFIGRARPGFVHAAEAEEREEVRLAG